MRRLCSHLIMMACLGFVSITCFSQAPEPPYFTFETSASGPTPSNLYAVDVNNDGITDIIQDSGNPGITGGYFTVSINTGNGTFQPPVTYKINSSTSTPLTWGDFNNDGKVDIAVMLSGTNQFAIYLGNGDGTFQLPITMAIDLPSGTTFNVSSPNSSIVAADFNHDGNLDLVAAASSDDGAVWSVYLLLGDGTGHFTDPTAIYYPTSGWRVQTIVAGDFDTDDNADVTLLEDMYCSGGIGDCYSNVVTLFGNGGTAFDPVDVTTFDGTMTLGSADLNQDGATDLYGIERESNGEINQLAVFTGHYGRNFSYFYTPVSDPNIGTPMAMADFDGNLDLAALTATYTSTGSATYQMIYFLNAGLNPTASIAYGPSPGGNATFQLGPVLGNFNGDVKLDIAVNASSASTPGSAQYSPTTTLAVGIDDSPEIFFNYLCNFPSSGQGIRLCSPSSQTTAGPVEFKAAANSFGMLRKIELWINGEKQGERDSVYGGSGFFEWFLQNMTPGTYNATLFAVNIDNTNQQYNFTVNVGNTCGPPPQGAYGINVCTPNGAQTTYYNPLQVAATANITGTLARMEVWIDGVKEYTETNSTALNTTFTLSDGNHVLNIYAVNTLGQEWEATLGTDVF